MREREQTPNKENSVSRTVYIDDVFPICFRFPTLLYIISFLAVVMQQYIWMNDSRGRLTITSLQK